MSKPSSVDWIICGYFILLAHHFTLSKSEHNLRTVATLYSCPNLRHPTENPGMKSELILPMNLISRVYRKQNYTSLQFRLTGIGNELHCGTAGSSFRTAADLVPTENSDKISFTPTGYLQIGNDIYNPKQFCVQNHTYQKMELHICNQTCDDSKGPICIPKCCHMGQVMDLSDWDDIKCADSGEKNWAPLIYSDPHTKLSPDAELANPNFYIPNMATLCEAEEPPDIITLRDIPSIQGRIPFRILRDGTVVRKISRVDWEQLPVFKYCVDGAQNFPGNPHLYSGLEADTVIVQCSEAAVNFDPPPHRVLYGFSMLTSALCLLITLIVNTVIPNPNNLHRKSYRLSLMSYFVSFLCMQVFMGAAHLLPYYAEEAIAYEDSMARKICTVIGVCTHLFSLWTFCWLSSINFEIWSTFRKIRTKTESGYKRYCFHAFLSLAVSVPIIITGLILEHFYWDDLEGEVIIPEYGKQSCFLEPIYASFYYLYLPIGLLILFNTCLYFLTVHMIWKSTRDVKSASAANQRTKQTNLAVIFIKLYLIMGIPWIFDVISWALTRQYSIIPWHWKILDLLVISQGFAVLYIFCLSGETRRAILNKYPNLKHILTPTLFFSRITSWWSTSKSEIPSE